MEPVLSPPHPSGLRLASCLSVLAPPQGPTTGPVLSRGPVALVLAGLCSYPARAPGKPPLHALQGPQLSVSSIWPCFPPWASDLLGTKKGRASDGRVQGQCPLTLGEAGSSPGLPLFLLWVLLLMRTFPGEWGQVAGRRGFLSDDSVCPESRRIEASLARHNLPLRPGSQASTTA